MKTACCIMVKNEQESILEWIVYHKVLGFDEIILVDHSSDDRTVDMAQLASLVVPVSVINEQRLPPRLQERVYLEVCDRFKETFEWIAFLDADEFLVSSDSAKLADLLSINEANDAIAVPWLFYGSSGWDRRHPGLVTEVYNNRSEFSFDPNELVKSIVRPKSVIDCPNSHCFLVKGSYGLPDGSQPAWKSPGRLHHFPSTSNWRVNHYYTRSREHWERRMKRGQLGGFVRTWAEFAAYDRNEVADTSAHKILPQVKAILAGLR